MSRRKKIANYKLSYDGRGEGLTVVVLFDRQFAAIDMVELQKRVVAHINLEFGTTVLEGAGHGHDKFMVSIALEYYRELNGRAKMERKLESFLGRAGYKREHTTLSRR